MKLAFIGDVQLDDRTPRSRKDDYCLSVILKLDWIFNWCLSNQIDRIIFLGDFFNRKEVGGRARNMAIKLFKKYYNKPGFPQCFITVGNHDTSNDVHNIKQSSLWTLVQTGLLTLEDYDPVSRVAFCHHHVHIDKEIEDHGLSHPDALIWSVHASLYTNKYQYLIDFNKLKLSGPAELFVCGHVHTTYSCQRSDGRMLINPGHIGRNAFAPYVKDQPVQFLYVEHDNANITHTEYIKIENAKSYDQVFDLDKIKLQKSIKKQVRSLIDRGSDIEIDSFTIDSIIEHAKKQLSKSSVDLIIKYIGEANAKS